MRGMDAELPWVLLATAYDARALDEAADHHLNVAVLERYGIGAGVEKGTYALHYTVTAQEVARTAANPPRPLVRSPA